jgi:hypothetical protein
VALRQSSALSPGVEVTTAVSVIKHQLVCVTPKNNWSPPVTSPLLGKRCWPAWPHYTLPHPNGKHRYQGESSYGGGNARSALQPTPGPPGTRKPADSRASPSGARRPRSQPGAAVHRRKRHGMLTHMPSVAAKAPGTSSIHGACAPVVSFRSSSSRSPRRYELRMRSVQRPPRRRTWRSTWTRRFVPST